MRDPINRSEEKLGIERAVIKAKITSLRQHVLAVVAFVYMHHSANNSQHCWANNVVTLYCVRLHGS